MDNMNIETRENMGIKEIPTNAEKNRNRSPFDSNQASEIVSNQEEKSLSHSAYHRH